MVKGEVDIVEDWVIYHGEIFGYNNIYVIDNYSLDGTFEKLIELKNEKNIHVCRLKDYKKKGLYMTNFIKQICSNEIAFPIDIDEFIVYYNKNTNTINCDKDLILNYINRLIKAPVYKMNYIFSKILNDNGYGRAAVESTNGVYIDYGANAKSFFHSVLFKGVIDHGNHYSVPNYILTDLCLIHFHERNLEQMKKKIYNNVKGLGHDPFNINYLKTINNTSTVGFHHVDHQIKVLENTYKLNKQSIEPGDICLKPFNNFLIELITDKTDKKNNNQLYI
jgi:hypothetical protein